MALSDRLIKVQHGSFSLAVENHRSRIADFIGPFRFGSPSLLATPVAALTGALHLKHRFEKFVSVDRSGTTSQHQDAASVVKNS
jgi:hypothetical protein